MAHIKRSTSRLQLPQADAPKSTFLSLPTEIRLEILRYCLKTTHVREKICWLMPNDLSSSAFARHLNTEHQQTSLEQMDTLFRGFQSEDLSQTTYPLHTNLLCICKQLYREGSDVLYNENKFGAIEIEPEIGMQSPPRTQRWCWKVSSDEFDRGFKRTRHGFQTKSAPLVTIMNRFVEPPSITMRIFPMAELERAVRHLQRERGPDSFTQFIQVLIGGDGDETDISRPNKLSQRVAEHVLPWLGNVMENKLDFSAIGTRKAPTDVASDAFNVWGKRLESRLPSGSLGFPSPCLWQTQICWNQLYELQKSFNLTGPRKASVCKLADLIDQTKNAVYDHAYRGYHSRKIIYVLVSALYLFAFIDVESVRNEFTMPEVTALRRYQLACCRSAVYIRAMKPTLRARFQVRSAVLLRYLGYRACATQTFEEFIVSFSGGPDIRDPQARAKWTEAQIEQAGEKAGLNRLSYSKGYDTLCRLDEDFARLANGWCEYSEITEKPDYLRNMKNRGDFHRLIATDPKWWRV